MERRNLGFTLLEVMIALTIMALLAVNISMVTRTGTEAARAGIFDITLNDEADATLDRISLAVMSSRADDIYPRRTSPGFTSDITYTVTLGYEGGVEVQSPPESIAFKLTPLGGQIVWLESPGEAAERRVVWSNWVPTLGSSTLAKEVLNGVDDNGNELPDESGLAFDMQGDLVNIHLTIERINPQGNLVPAVRLIQVTCRN